MFDRALAIFGLALALILGLAPFVWPKVPRRLAAFGVAVGVMLMVVGFVLALIPGEPTPPDITLALVGPKRPALLLINPSDTVAKDIKWGVILWNLRTPEQRTPLPIPFSTFDFIRPHETGGPNELFDDVHVAPLVQPHTRLVGYASVSCPSCVWTRLFWVYIVYDEGGWISPLPAGKHVDINRFSELLPKIAEDPERFFADVPSDSRVPIRNLEKFPDADIDRLMAPPEEGRGRSGSLLWWGVGLLAIVAIALASRPLWHAGDQPAGAPSSLMHPVLIVDAGFLFKQINGHRALIAVLSVANRPLGPDSPTARVIPHIQYTDATNKRFDVTGRWGDSPLPEHPDRAVEPIDIPPGVTRLLDIAISFDEDSKWYALDNRSPFFAYRVPQYLLTPTVVVSTRFVGNVPDEAALHIFTLRRTFAGQNRFDKLPMVPNALAHFQAATREIQSRQVRQARAS